MSTNLNRYTKILDKYNTTLEEYREALQKNDSHAVSEKYQGLIEISGKLKEEFARIDQGLIAKHNKFLHKEYQAYKEVEALKVLYKQDQSEGTLQAMHEKSAIYYNILNEKRAFTIETGIYQCGDEISKLNDESKEIRMHYNETISEGDLITLGQRQQIYDINQKMHEINNQYDVIKGEYPKEIQTIAEYEGHLSDSELSTVVLDDHMFYRLITSKQYTKDQFDKIFYEVSENLAKKPMTVAEIIGFCKNNGIPHFSDNEFRSLIKNENKDYEDTSRSVRDVAKYDYIAKNSEMTTSHQIPDSHSRGNVKTTTIVDADSFYKFIDTKMVRGEYTSQQEHKLYVDISEVLVHSPLTKGQINEIYHKYNIIPPTEREWGRLIERQESRRETDHISKNSDNLKFQGNIDIEFKNQDFKFKVDLYYRDKLSNEIKASQGEGKSNSGLSGKPERDLAQNNSEFQPDIDNIENILLETTKAFNESFGIRKSGDVANFRIFILDDAENYLKYSKEARGHATTSDNGNTANVYLFFGDNNYNDDNDLLRHEFAHALTFHATSKLGLSRTFMEGIAEYTVGKMHGKSNADFVKMIPEENFKFSIEHLVKYTPNENDHYVTGAAIIAYLEENHPNFLDNLLYAANDAIKSDKHIDVMEMMNKFFQEQGSKPISEIDWFRDNATPNQLNAPQATELDDLNSQAYHHSGGYSGPPVQVKSLDKQNPVANNAIQPGAQKPIVLNFQTERGEPINQYYFSARIKLTEESKNFLRETLGQDVEFNNIDGYLDLDPKTFYIGNGYDNRAELYVRGSSGSVLVGSLPLNHYGLSIEISADGSKITDHGFYSLSVIHNPDFYNKDSKEKDKEPSGLDGSKFLEDVKNTLLSHNGNGVEQKNIFTQVSNNIAEKEEKAEEEKKLAEEALTKKNIELKESIDKGDIVIYRVREKANPDDDERSSAILKMTKKSQKALGISDEDNKGIKLDPNKFWITEIKAKDESDSLYAHNGKYLYSVRGDVNTGYNDLFYVLDKNDPSKSGFYDLGQDKFKSPAKYLDTKFKYASDSELHHKLLSHTQIEQALSDQPVVNVQKTQKQHDSSNSVEFKEAIGKGDVIIYRVKENGNSDDKYASTTFKMIKKSKEAEANNEYMRSVKLDSRDFDIRKVGHQEDVRDGDQLFYVLYKNDHSKSGFYNLGKDEVKFKTLVKSLGDHEHKCTYYDNIDDKFLSSEQNNHKQQYAHKEQMQSDQPQASHKVDKHHTKHEDIVLKNTILSVGKGEEVTLPNGQKIHKVEIKVKYEDIKSLYEKAASSEEQQYVLDFYYKLKSNSFKIGDLPKGKYYFKGDKFIIQDKQGKSIKLPEKEISLQLMHLKDHQGKDHLELVVLNKADGKVIGNIHEIDNLSYGLLKSDSDILSHLEIQGHDITIHGSDYDTYLTHGLDSHVLGNHHHGDHTFI